MIDLKNLTISKAHNHLKNGDFSAVELAEEYLNNIKKNDAVIKAYLEIFSDTIEQAKVADSAISKKKEGFLRGYRLRLKTTF